MIRLRLRLARIYRHTAQWLSLRADAHERSVAQSIQRAAHQEFGNECELISRQYREELDESDRDWRERLRGEAAAGFGPQNEGRTA